MCTHNLCFEQKYENSQNISTKNCLFYSLEKSLYIALACFRNELIILDTSANYSHLVAYFSSQVHFRVI